MTGSAHSVMAPYWAKVLGKTTMAAHQCSPRGGNLQVTVDGDGGKVLASGAAAIVIEGTLNL